jgi:CRP-like cAMP-binding protein
VTLDDDVARLTRTHPFNLMPREAVQLIAFSCEKRRLSVGETLFCFGEVADAGYFVVSGVITLLEDGAEPEGARSVGACALIGESALYGPIERRVEARVSEDAVVIRVQRETFRRVLAEFPAAANKIRAALAARTQRLIDRLDAARIKSFDGAVAPEPRAGS